MKIQRSLFCTQNTKKAATFLTLGIPFFDPEVPPVSNIYCDDKPYRPGLPGNVTYHLADQNADGVEAEALERAFDEDGPRTADIRLDELVNEIFAIHPEFGARLRALLPLALARYARGFAENRDRIQSLWKQAKPMVLVKKGPTSAVLVELKPSASTRAQFGI